MTWAGSEGTIPNHTHHHVPFYLSQILRIGIDLKPIAFSCHGGSRDVAILMGLWFRIFPLNISDLALTSVDLTRVRSLINYADRDRDQDGYWKPFFENVGDELVAEVKQQLSGIANAYGQASSVANKQLKLLGSTGDAHQGFVCPQYPASFSESHPTETLSRLVLQ